MVKLIHSVLAVDEDPVWVDFLCRVVGSEYPVTYATSGEDAVRRAAAVRPGVIIMGCKADGRMDGYSLFSELQRHPACCHIPVIMLAEELRGEGGSNPAFSLYPSSAVKPAAFLEKPVDPEDLLCAVRSAIGARARGLSDSIAACFSRPQPVEGGWRDKGCAALQSCNS